MPWTTPKTWSATTVTAAEFNEQIRDNTDWLKAALALIGQTSDSTLGQLKAGAYGCVLNRTAAQSINDATDTAVTFPTGSHTEELDTDAFHSGAVNTARITIPTGGAGWYDVGGTVRFATNATGVRVVWIEVDGSGGTGTIIVEGRYAAVSGTQTGINVSTFVYLDAGQYITLGVRQTSGGALDIATTAYAPRFWAMRRFAA